jgi:glutaminyl-peptide cyclotransferase
MRPMTTDYCLRALIALLFTLPVTWASQAEELPIYGYKVTAKLPQPRENFVQGLQVVDGQLYVSSGNYGQSKLLRYQLEDGRLIDSREVDPRLFAEGLTVYQERIFQLTWRSRIVLVYNRSDLAPIEYFRIPGEGWGLTHNDSELIYSDGSDQLHYLSPTTQTITRSIKVTENGKPLRRLNELEWIDGQVWANVWQTDRIVIIDPETGEVTASVNLAGLLSGKERRPDTDVLNGIAHNAADNSLWVTGKRWPWIYQIELDPPKPAPPQESQAVSDKSG